MFRLEILTDHGDWVLWQKHYNQENADLSAKAREEAGYRTRVILQGVIVRESVEGL